MKWIFVIESKRKAIGLEVKTSTVRTSSGISAFKKRFHPDRVLLVGQTGISVKEFLVMEIESLLN